MRIYENRQLEMLRIFVRHDKQFLQAVRAAGINAEDAEQARQLVLNRDNGLGLDYRAGETEDYFMVRAIEAADNVTDILLAMHLHIIEAAEPAFFITSDHPVTLNINAVLDPVTTCLPAGSVIMPLSPNRSLLLSYNMISNQTIQVSHNQVRTINETTIRGAFDSVFADRESQEIQRALDNSPPIEQG